MSVVSRGKSNHSYNPITVTSHDQRGIGVADIESKGILSTLNGSQFRQVYSSFSLQSIHSQSQPKNNHGMTHHQTGRIATPPSLFLTLIHGGLLFSVNEAKWNTLLTHPISPISITSKEGLFSISHVVYS